MKKKVPPGLHFDDRLLTLLKERGITQQAPAQMVGRHISQIRRYEGGQSQPTLDTIRKLAVALSVSADMLQSIVLRSTVRAAERRFSPADSGGAPQ